MPLNKQYGNMFEFVDGTWNPLAGECIYSCVYCYVEDEKRKPILKSKYSGGYRVLPHELEQYLYKFGKGITIFVQNMSDLFAEGVYDEDIERVLGVCRDFPENTYLFLTKNPGRYERFLGADLLPPRTILGTTVESDHYEGPISKAPAPADRITAMKGLRKHYPKVRRFVSIEPIMKFDHDALVEMIRSIEPEYVAIGADSKNSGLPEPEKADIITLVIELGRYTEVKLKSNLKRIVDIQVTPGCVSF